jgi:hypothetical protein
MCPAAAASTATNRTLTLRLSSGVGYVFVCHVGKLLPDVTIRVASTLGSCCNSAGPCTMLVPALLLLLAPRYVQLQPGWRLFRQQQTLADMFAPVCVHFDG